jgi:chromosome segregation ATPase
MRRESSSHKTKTPEKKKQEEIVQAIAVDEGVLHACKLEIQKTENVLQKLKVEEATLKDNIKDLKQKHKSALTDCEKVANDIKTLQSALVALEQRMRTLKSDEEIVVKNINDEQRKFNEVTQQHSKTTIELQEAHLSKKKEYEDEIFALEEQRSLLVKIIEQISKDIEDKKREQLSIDATLLVRVEELAKLNSNLDTTKSASVRAANKLKEIDDKILSLESEIKLKDKEIEEKNSEIIAREKDVENRRNELVALMGREKKIDEKAQAVKDLFQLAGLNIEV